MSAAAPLRERAPAKVNLFLHVGPARADGRHALDSLVVFAGERLADELTFSPQAEPSLDLTGPFARESGPPADNLVLRAAAALEAAAGRPLRGRWQLDKQIPAAAGLGGGSADAGAALRLLTRAFDLPAHLAGEVAPRLGGDVPAAWLSRPCRMQGDGDRIAPVPRLPALPALIVHPGRACPTGPVFARYDAFGASGPLVETDLPVLDRPSAIIAWLAAATRNDLEAPAIDLVPEIGAVLAALDRLPGARLARMTGSGATCFALFGSLPAAEMAGAALAEVRPDWWQRAVMLEGAP